MSLIEVLVLILIVAILAALVAVGVQSSREAARRALCLNNLKQIATASLNFAARHNGSLPPGINDRGYSFLVSILPDLEEEPRYSSLNFELGNGMFIHRANSTASTTRISTYTCPSETLVPPGGISWTNYAGNRGVAYQIHERYNGPLGGTYSATVKLRNIGDGTSMTALSAEWMIGTPNQDTRHPVRSVFWAEEFFLPDQYEAFLQACAGVNVAEANLSVQRKGYDWMHGELGRSLYNHDMPINGHTCTNGSLVQHGAWTASSAHPGGANVVFVDGHVKFIRDSVSLRIWHAIGTMDGKEVVTDLRFEG